MIVWISSYPKSGNTWVRGFIASLLYTNSGENNFSKLEKIKQFPTRKLFKNFVDNFQNINEVSKNWVNVQNFINLDNKIKFLKTHHTNCSIGKFNFTDDENTIGVIHIVRDPRNVITSIKNHYSFDDQAALKFVTNVHTEIREANSNDFRTWTLLSNWSNHYKSWVKSKNFRKLIVRYEDFEKKKYETFRGIVEFTNTLLNKTEKINEVKLERAIETTNFNVLKNKEKNEGFEEAAFSKDEKGKKIFFNLGFNNRWKKLLKKEIRERIEIEFNKEMKELGYF